MAIQKTVELESGITITDAYIKVTWFGGLDIISYIASVYVSRQLMLDGKPIIAQERYTFTPSYESGSVNLKEQIYNNLKTVPKYIDAVDILEEEQTT